MISKAFLTTFIIILLCKPVFNTLSKSDSKSKKSGSQSEETLVTRTPKAKSIILEHSSYSVSKALVKHFPNEVLAYVTPWNSHGYDIAKMFGAKFSLLSPVWLQLKPQNPQEWEVTGLHDVDANWLKSVRATNPDISIVPRIIFEGLNGQSTETLLKGEVTNKIAAILIKLAQEHKFDGYVVEFWSQVAGSERSLAKMKHEVIINLVKALQDRNLKFILVIPPPLFYHGPSNKLYKGLFQRDDFAALAPHVSAFSLMTYDYSTGSDKPGPNSPSYWVTDCVEELSPDANDKFRSKILLGLNMYGYEFKPRDVSPVVGPQYLQLLKSHNPKIKWDKAVEEHIIEIKSSEGASTVYYPTLYSVQQRLALAQQLGVGVSLWEVGQGLDYFYDLF